MEVIRVVPGKTHVLQLIRGSQDCLRALPDSTLINAYDTALQNLEQVQRSAPWYKAMMESTFHFHKDPREGMETFQNVVTNLLAQDRTLLDPPPEELLAKRGDDLTEDEQKRLMVGIWRETMSLLITELNKGR